MLGCLIVLCGSQPSGILRRLNAKKRKFRESLCSVDMCSVNRGSVDYGSF
jgi:hypothetical protein